MLKKVGKMCVKGPGVSICFVGMYEIEYKTPNGKLVILYDAVGKTIYVHRGCFREYEDGTEIPYDVQLKLMRQFRNAIDLFEYGLVIKEM